LDPLERWAAEHPQDPEREALLAWIRTGETASRGSENARTLGFALFVFRKR
jgi:hypothetical protein